jgi:serine/threonine-protein kinase
MIPDAIGRYQVFAQLGAGGFATVYRAYDPRLDRDVAIKVLHPALARDPDMRDRFLDEARALASIRHPHLVRLFDAGEADGMVYLAMEFIAGRSLDAVIQHNSLSVDDVCRVVSQVASALDALHDSGLVHRDVKPANIMLADDGRAVLVDLGVARSLKSTGITSPSVIMGTPGFLAPEQLGETEAAGPRTDVYQLAATAYTLLSGRPPFLGSAAEVLYAIAHRAAPDLQELCPDLPPGMAAAIVEALAKNPQRRPARAGAFAAALTAAALPQTVIMSPRPATSARPKAPPASVATVQATVAGPASAGARGQTAAAAMTSPVLPRRRTVFRWPLAIAACGVALVVIGSSAVAVSYRQEDGNDAPRTTTDEAVQPPAWLSPARGVSRETQGAVAPPTTGPATRPASLR